MAYRGGGREGRGGQGRGTEGERPTGFVCPPPAPTPSALPPPMGYHAPMAMHQPACHAPPAIYHPAPTPTPPAPQVVFAPAPAPVPVTIRAPSHAQRGGQGRGTGGGRPTVFVCPPPVQTPRPVPLQYQAPPMGYHAPMAMHQPAYGHAPPAVYRPAPAPPAPQVVFAPRPAPVPVTIRAPSLAPSPALSAAMRQPASAPAPASSAPSAAAVAEKVEQKPFVSETALATQEGKDGAAEDASDVDLAPVSKKGLAHLARPGVGTVGKKVMIRANHFLVDVADSNLFHYDVYINPESKSSQTNREVLNELIKLHGKTSLGGKLPAYDGRKSLYTAGSLPFESEDFIVTLVDPEKKEKERAEREYKITIRIAGRTEMYHLTQFLRRRQRDVPQETIQVLDVVLRESPSWNYVTVSKSFFSTSFGHRGDIGEGLESWRGYYQSLRPTQMRLSLNIDISATSFVKPMSVIKFVEEFLNIRDTSRPLSDRDQVKIKKALRGVRIETSHQKDQIRRYKITGITPIPMSQLIFSVDEQGMRKTVVQYFWDEYDYRLKYASWPCLQAGSNSRPVYLPMEVCKIVEGQRYSKKINDKQVTNILRATCKRPQEREQSIRDMVLHNTYAEDKFAQDFGIHGCNDQVLVPAHVLPPPLLKYHDSGWEKVCAPSVEQWNMINKKMINGGIVENWTCLNFSCMRPKEIQRFCVNLIHMCNATGMTVTQLPCIDVRSVSSNHIEKALRDVQRRATQTLAQQATAKQLQLLIVILPDVSGSYGKIKRVCETEIGIVSQCCLPRHASRPNKQYLENVALKIKAKVGRLKPVLDDISFVSKVPKLTEGDSASSFAAAISSVYRQEITKYRSLVSAQWTGQETPNVGSSASSSSSNSQANIQDVSEEDLSGTPTHLSGVHIIEQRSERSGQATTDVPSPRTHISSGYTSSSDEITASVRLGAEHYCCIVKQGTTVESLVTSVFLANCKEIRADECWYTNLGGNVLRLDTTLTDAITVDVNCSLNGGAPPDLPDMSLKEWLDYLHYPKIFFLRTYVPTSLRRRKVKKPVRYTIQLDINGLDVINDAMDWMESLHEAGLSFNGMLSPNDLIYSWAKGSRKLTASPLAVVHWVPLTGPSYKEDCLLIVELVDGYLRYMDESKEIMYPMHLGHLVRRIKDLKPDNQDFSSKDRRSLITKHPGTKSLYGRIGVINNLINKYQSGFDINPGLDSDKAAFEKHMNKELDGPTTWTELVTDILRGAPLEMERMFFSSPTSSGERFKVYRDTRLGRLDFSRCLLKHAKGATDVQVESALYLHWDAQLAEIQELLLDFEPPSNKDRTRPASPKLSEEGVVLAESLEEKEEVDVKRVWDM